MQLTGHLEIFSIASFVLFVTRYCQEVIARFVDMLLDIALEVCVLL